MTASTGTWTNSPTSYAYQWLRCEGYGEGGAEEELGQECEPIEGATASAYTPQAADARHSLRVTVKASNAAGWSLAVSKPEVVLGTGEETLSLAPESVSAPTITGVAVQGRTLTEHHGGWEGEVASYSYKWLRCKGHTAQGTGTSCGAIPGASAQSYTLAAEDVGMWIEVQETALNSGGWNVASSEAARSDPARSAAEHRPPGHHRDDPAGPDAERPRRHLDQHRQDTGVAVAALRRSGLRLHRDQRCHQKDLQARTRRRRAHPGGQRNGRKRHRAQRPRDVGRDDRRAGATARARKHHACPRSPARPSRGRC